MSAPPTGNGAPGGDGAASPATEWAKRAADTVDLVVDTIHDKAIRPAALAVRAVVFGLLIAVFSIVMLVLLSVALLRLLDSYAFEGRVWLSYLVLGAVFSVGGLLVWSRRIDRSTDRARRS